MGRILSIDFLKGFTIVLVVVGHLIQGSDVNFDQDHLFRYIYSFHMPLFMFLSGFCSAMTGLFLAKIPRRAIQLLTPFFIWPVIYGLFNHNLSLTTYSNLLINPYGGLWFLWNLFFICLLNTAVYAFCRHFHIRRPTIGLISMAFILFLTSSLLSKNMFGFKSITWYNWFFIFGMAFYTNRERFNLILGKCTPYLFSLFLIAGFFWMRNEVPTFIGSSNHYILLAYKFITAFIGILSIYGLAHRFIRQDSGNQLVFLFTQLGKNTLGIYACNFLMVDFSIFLLAHIQTDRILYYTLTTIIAVTLCYAFVFIFKKIPLTSFLLFGNYPPHKTGRIAL